MLLYRHAHPHTITPQPTILYTSTHSALCLHCVVSACLGASPLCYRPAQQRCATPICTSRCVYVLRLCHYWPCVCVRMFALTSHTLYQVRPEPLQGWHQGLRDPERALPRRRDLLQEAHKQHVSRRSMDLKFVVPLVACAKISCTRVFSIISDFSG